jgi:hypothetical protein
MVSLDIVSYDVHRTFVHYLHENVGQALPFQYRNEELAGIECVKLTPAAMRQCSVSLDC